MPQPFYAVIFDLDGVLADSEPWWNEIDAKLLAEHGVTYRGEYHRNVLGVSYRLAVEFYKKAFGLSVPSDEMMQRRGGDRCRLLCQPGGDFPFDKTGSARAAADEPAPCRRHKLPERVRAPVSSSARTDGVFRSRYYRRGNRTR